MGPPGQREREEAGCGEGVPGLCWPRARGREERERWAAAEQAWLALSGLALFYFFLKTFLLFYVLFSEITITFKIFNQINSNKFV